MRWLLQRLKTAAGWLLALVVLFEEWGWEPLQRALGRLAKLPLIGALERWIGTLPPRAAMAVFVLPSLLLLPVKVLALWLIGSGHALLGAATVIAAKLVGTALVARLFTLTRPALMQLAWFAAVYTLWVAWKDAAMAHVRASWPWRAGRVMKRAAQRRWARWVQAAR
jgi:hypothetical protein